MRTRVDLVEVDDVGEDGRGLARRLRAHEALGVDDDALAGADRGGGVDADDEDLVGDGAARARTSSWARSQVDVCAGKTMTSAPIQASWRATSGYQMS